MKRWLVIACACSAPAQPAVIESRADDRSQGARANDCPYITLFTPWTEELFPACAPISFGSALGICVGSNCANEPCELEMRSKELTRITKNVFDARGRFVAKFVDGTPQMTCAYDGDYRSRCTTGDVEYWVTRDANGRITALVNDVSNRPVTYDRAGRVLSVGDSRFAYDERGWLREQYGQEVEHDEAGHLLRVGTTSPTLYRYDGDRVIEVQSSPQSRILLFYDEQNRLARTESPAYSIAWHLRYDCK